MLPETFRLGPLILTTAGSVYGIALLTLLLISAPRVRRRGIAPRHLGWMAPLLLPPVALGAIYAHALDRGGLDCLRYWIYAPLVHPGSSFLGGLAGGLGTSWLYCRLRGIRPRAFFDAVAPGLLVLYAIGRVGCHLEGHTTCCGAESDAWYAVVYPHTLGPGVRVVPTALLEAVASGLAALLLLSLERRGHCRAPFVGYLLLQGGERFAVELLRTNPTHQLGLSQAQWLSAGMIAAALAALALGTARARGVDSPP